MRGYLSLFTKMFLLVIIISSAYLLLKEANEKRYEYQYVKEETIKEKYRVERSIEEELAILINYSCKYNKSIAKKFYFPYEVRVGEKVCGNVCYDISKEFNEKKLIGEKLITIDCKKREVYD